MNAWYHPHHRRLAEATQRALGRHGRALLIRRTQLSFLRPFRTSWTSGWIAPTFASAQMSSIPLPNWKRHSSGAFGSTGWTVRVNTPFAGVLVPISHHYRKEHHLAAVMIEGESCALCR